MRRGPGEAVAILWVALAPGERMADVLDRRGGVDVLLGGPPSAFARLADSGRLVRVEPSDPLAWRIARRPRAKAGPAASPPARAQGDPRDDPSALASARRSLDSEGWAKGYEGLVRLASLTRPTPGRPEAPGPDDPPADESAAIPAGGRDPARSRRFLKALEGLGLVEAAPAGSAEAASADSLLADLLGVALVDAREELRDAESALRRFNHPPAAEGAIGERPPWPPASVARLLARPADGPLVDMLAEQIAPDPDARDWLRASWSRPGRPVDGELLAGIAAAADGRLAREPRFRAWLRAEWTAWTRQLYRRVARVAGGYVPS